MSFQYTTVQGDTVTVLSDLFAKMMERRALIYAQPYLTEEREALLSFLERLKTVHQSKLNLCVIGDAAQFYRDIALDRGLNYAAIDPLLPASLASPSDPRVKLLNKPFEFVLSHEIFSGSNLFIFTFNVFYYLPDPFAALQELSKPGDVLWLSGWTNTQLADQTMRNYFSYLYDDHSPGAFPHLPSLEGVDFSSMSDRIRRCQLSICETLEIYL